MNSELNSRGNQLIVLLAVVVIALALLLTAVTHLRPVTTPEVQTSQPTLAAVAVLPTAVPSPSGTPTIPPTLPAPTTAAPTAAAPTAVPPTATFIPTPQPITHRVAAGEVLLGIAARYGVSVEAIVAQNGLANADAIWEGQTLLIPLTGEATAVAATAVPAPATITVTMTAVVEPTAVAPLISPPTAAAPAAWPPSLISGDLDANYPLLFTTTSGQVRLHYQPDTYPQGQMAWLAPAVDQIWAETQQALGGSLGRPIDVYLAGTWFGVNPALQGFTQSWEYRSFVLVNGAFADGETLYIIAHELTHIAATHLLGAPAATMLHEGLALHLPQPYLTQQAGYLPHTQICAAILPTTAFKTATQMSAMGYNTAGFGGHIRSFFHYTLSGCFVAYLLETYGFDAFARLYSSGDYEGVYGRSLAALDQEWQVWLAAMPVTVDGAQLAAMETAVVQTYETFLTAVAAGEPMSWDAYLRLNRARQLVHQGNFAGAEVELGRMRDDG